VRGRALFVACCLAGTLGACSSPNTTEVSNVAVVSALPQNSEFLVLAYPSNDGRKYEPDAPGQVIAVGSDGELSAVPVPGMLSGGITARPDGALLMGYDTNTLLTKTAVKDVSSGESFERIPDQFTLPSGVSLGIANVGGDGSSYISTAVSVNAQLETNTGQLSGYVQSIGQCADSVYAILTPSESSPERPLWRISADSQGQITSQQITKTSKPSGYESVVPTIACGGKETVQIVANEADRRFVLRTGADGSQELAPVTGPAMRPYGAVANQPGMTTFDDNIIYPSDNGELLSIDPATGSSEKLGQLPSDVLGNNVIYASFSNTTMHFLGQNPDSYQWSLYATDLNNGATTTVQALPGLEPFLLENDISTNGFIPID
jgi:hypothetical protein